MAAFAHAQSAADACRALFGDSCNNVQLRDGLLACRTCFVAGQSFASQDVYSPAVSDLVLRPSRDYSSAWKTIEDKYRASRKPGASSGHYSAWAVAECTFSLQGRIALVATDPPERAPDVGEPLASAAVPTDPPAAGSAGASSAAAPPASGTPVALGLAPGMATPFTDAAVPSAAPTPHPAAYSAHTPALQRRASLPRAGSLPPMPASNVATEELRRLERSNSQLAGRSRSLDEHNRRLSGELDSAQRRMSGQGSESAELQRDAAKLRSDLELAQQQVRSCHSSLSTAAMRSHKIFGSVCRCVRRCGASDQLCRHSCRCCNSRMLPGAARNNSLKSSRSMRQSWRHTPSARRRTPVSCAL
jgi:hypothetical protein